MSVGWLNCCFTAQFNLFRSCRTQSFNLSTLFLDRILKRSTRTVTMEIRWPVLPCLVKTIDGDFRFIGHPLQIWANSKKNPN